MEKPEQRGEAPGPGEKYPPRTAVDEVRRDVRIDQGATLEDLPEASEAPLLPEARRGYPPASAVDKIRRDVRIDQGATLDDLPASTLTPPPEPPPVVDNTLPQEPPPA